MLYDKQQSQIQTQYFLLQTPLSFSYIILHPLYGPHASLYNENLSFPEIAEKR